jgi:hypothetical protein
VRRDSCAIAYWSAVLSLSVPNAITRIRLMVLVRVIVLVVPVCTCVLVVAVVDPLLLA